MWFEQEGNPGIILSKKGEDPKRVKLREVSRSILTTYPQWRYLQAPFSVGLSDQLPHGQKKISVGPENFLLKSINLKLEDEANLPQQSTSNKQNPPGYISKQPNLPSHRPSSMFLKEYRSIGNFPQSQTSPFFNSQVKFSSGNQIHKITSQDYLYQKLQFRRKYPQEPYPSNRYTQGQYRLGKYSVGHKPQGYFHFTRSASRVNSRTVIEKISPIIRLAYCSPPGPGSLDQGYINKLTNIRPSCESQPTIRNELSSPDIDSSDDSSSSKSSSKSSESTRTSDTTWTSNDSWNSQEDVETIPDNDATTQTVQFSDDVARNFEKHYPKFDEDNFIDYGDDDYGFDPIEKRKNEKIKYGRRYSQHRSLCK